MSIVTNEFTNDSEEIKVEKHLRPRTFKEVIGRKNVIESLVIMIEAAKKRGDALDHLIFYGPPGLGKTSISNVVSGEMGVGLHVTSGPAIERQGDLVAILTNLQRGDILFIDEIHRLNKTIEEVLYPAMEDKKIDIIIGKGPSAKTLEIELSDFTLIGATTKISKLSSPLRDRFGGTFRFDYYDYDDLAEIVKQKAKILSVVIDDESAYYIAQRSRRTPRISIRILKRVRDFAEVRNDGVITTSMLPDAFRILSIDDMGLDMLDRKLLLVLQNNFDGGPVGVNTLAASVGEEVETIEDVTEPFLIREGLIQRTSRGRVITIKGEEHLLKLKNTNEIIS